MCMTLALPECKDAPRLHSSYGDHDHNVVQRPPHGGVNAYSRTSEAYDEPLEDAIAIGGTTFTQTTTDAAGSFSFASVPDGRYFVTVEPGMADAEHLPGGSMCRESRDAVELRGSTEKVMVSSSPSSAATYVGMTTCLVCHPDEATEKTLAHRLGFRVPGISSTLQDTSEHLDIDDGIALFLDAAVFTAGTQSSTMTTTRLEASTSSKRR